MDAKLRASLPASVCGKRFYPRALRIIRETISEYEQCSRKEITRQVCDQLGWVDHRGQRKEMGAAVALLRFYRKGWIELPPARSTPRATSGIQPLPDGFQEPERILDCSLKGLGKIMLRPVTDRGDSRLWNGLISRYHYRGYAPLCGSQIRYLIATQGRALGAISFSAAAVTLRDRDRWIGWNQHQRRANRHLIVNNSRFLILPWVRVRNLASHLLARAAHRLPADFHARYGYAPVLLETFVEQQRFTGTCYQAANWMCVGQTSGRGRSDLRSWKQRKIEAPPLPIKSIWLYPLVSDCQARLCRETAA